MSAIKNFLVVVTLGILTLTPAIAADTRAEEPARSGAREGFNQPLVLSHLKTMKVIIGEIDKVALDHGVTKENLKKLIADELASTHVTICGDEADCCKGDSSGGCEPGTVPLLYLKLKAVKPNYLVKAALVEKVQLKRNSKDVMVAVWSEDCVTSSSKNLKEAIDEQVRAVAREFRRDFALANSGDHS